MAPETRVYLDTSILIELVEGRSVARDCLVDVIKAAPPSPSRFVTSELSLAEVLVKPMELGRSDLLEAYEELLTPGDLIDIAPIDRPVLRGAAYQRCRNPGLKLMDAIHLATAGRARCTHVLTNDRRLRGSGDHSTVRLTEPELASLATLLMAAR